MQARHTVGAGAKGARCQRIYVLPRLGRSSGGAALSDRSFRPDGARRHDYLGAAEFGVTQWGRGVCGRPEGVNLEILEGGEIHSAQIDAKYGNLFCSHMGSNSKANMPVGVGRLAVNEGQLCIL